MWNFWKISFKNEPREKSFEKWNFWILKFFVETWIEFFILWKLKLRKIKNLCRVMIGNGSEWRRHGIYCDCSKIIHFQHEKWWCGTCDVKESSKLKERQHGGEDRKRRVGVRRGRKEKMFGDWRSKVPRKEEEDEEEKSALNSIDSLSLSPFK